MADKIEWSEDSAQTIIEDDFDVQTEYNFAVATAPLPEDNLYHSQVLGKDLTGIAIGECFSASRLESRRKAMSRALVNWRSFKEDVDAERARFTGEDEA